MNAITYAAIAVLFAGKKYFQGPECQNPIWQNSGCHRRKDWHRQRNRSALFYPLLWYVIKTSEQGAQTTIYCAVSEEMEGVSGKYLRDCTIVEPSKGAQDDAATEKLWDLSMKLVGLEK